VTGDLVFSDGEESAMKWICAASAALAMAATAIPVQAAAIQECPVPPGAMKVALPSGLPPALSDKVGNIALPGQPFNAIDVYVKGLPNRRYLYVWNIGNRWVAAMEQGGIALRAKVVVYDLSQDGKTATLIDNRMTSPGSVCAVATQMAGR
jgi:hypothetical protein